MVLSHQGGKKPKMNKGKITRALVSLMIVALMIALPFGTHVKAAEGGIDYEAVNIQIEKDVEENHIPGMAVCVVDKNGIVFEKTYGNCTSIDQPFIIGSMSKSFTALAIMQLVEQEKIDLNAPISDYIDDNEWFVSPSDCERITVKNLLNQTSGITTYQTFGNLIRTNSYDTHVYANANYGLLGLIIEAVSGAPYEEYITTNIFGPLKMNHSAVFIEQAKENGLVEGYRNYFGFPVKGNADFPEPIHNGTWTNIPAGYLSSSCADMGRYLQMYLNGGEGIVSSESIHKMFYDGVPVNDGEYYYGMGWQYSETVFRKPALWHAGLVENYTSYMIIFPEEGKAVAVLVNINDYLVENNILGNIIMPLLGEERQNLPNLYLILHVAIDFVCVLLLILSIYSVKRAIRHKINGKKAIIVDILVFLILPGTLLCIPLITKTPAFVIRLFVKDLYMIVYFCASVLIVAAICRIIHYAIWFGRKTKARNIRAVESMGSLKKRNSTNYKS